MLFRSQLGHVFSSRSRDRGLTWGGPEMLDALPNPDSKLDLIRLGPPFADGALVLAFNDNSFVRDHLRLAVSSDGGHSWQRVATIEDTTGEEYLLHLHYPTTLQVGCRILVAYSRFYGRRVPPGRRRAQGIRLVSVDARDFPAEGAKATARVDAAAASVLDLDMEDGPADDEEGPDGEDAVEAEDR